MKNIKYIIFDFDGTIADTLKFAIMISNKLSYKFNYKIITDDKLDSYRGMSAQELVKKSGIKYYKIPFVATQFKIEFKKVLDQLQVFPEIPAVLEELSKSFKLGILTSNAVENVNLVLKSNELSEYITFVNSQSRLYGKHISLRKIMAKYDLQKDNIVYIGDETRDIEATKKLGIKSISVTWGFNTKKILSFFSPDFMVDSPKDIVELMKDNH